MEKHRSFICDWHREVKQQLLIINPCKRVPKFFTYYEIRMTKIAWKSENTSDCDVKWVTSVKYARSFKTCFDFLKNGNRENCKNIAESFCMQFTNKQDIFHIGRTSCYNYVQSKIDIAKAMWIKSPNKTSRKRSLTISVIGYGALIAVV